MKAITLLSFAAAIAFVGVAPPALAQNQVPIDVYHFEDDDLIGETMGGTPPLLQVPKRPARVLLLRPRASFVAELLQSVEAL